MRRSGFILTVVASAWALTGCIERRMSITSDPSGAIVHLNDIEVGVTPVEVDFTFYGVYDVRLDKDGYDPLLTTAKASAPLYETPGIDLIAHALPTRLRNEVRWHFELTPADADPDELLERARSMREEAFEPEVPQPGGGR